MGRNSDCTSGSAEPVIQLGARHTVVHAGAEKLRDLRNAFSMQHYVRLPKLLSPQLLERVLADIERAVFVERSYEVVGVERFLAEGSAPHALLFVANDPSLFEVVAQITQCPPIGHFSGRVFRVASAGGHYDDWHDDLASHRSVAMSVNLSADEYRGGALEMRREGSPPMASIENPSVGNAVVFRLAPGFKHRIAPVQGTAPRTAFAGWFGAGPGMMDSLRVETGGRG